MISVQWLLPVFSCLRKVGAAYNSVSFYSIGDTLCPTPRLTPILLHPGHPNPHPTAPHPNLNSSHLTPLHFDPKFPHVTSNLNLNPAPRITHSFLTPPPPDLASSTLPTSPTPNRSHLVQTSHHISSHSPPHHCTSSTSPHPHLTSPRPASSSSDKSPPHLLRIFRWNLSGEFPSADDIEFVSSAPFIQSGDFNGFQWISVEYRQF